ncbi:MAG: hypothetical protein V3S69_04035, partial [Dehalococcoidales bacterium]
QDAINKLNTQLAINGEFSKEASAELQEFASELQRTSKFGDEAVLGQLQFAQAMGATKDQSKEVVGAAADMAAALGIDLNAATRNIAKTLGGFAGELGEVIPELKGLTKEQLQAGEGIDLLAKKFKGSAAGEIKSYSGALAQLSNTFGDFQETTGGAVVENQIFTELFKELSTIISELGQTFSDNSQEIKEGLGEVIITVLQIGQAFVAILDPVIRFGKAIVATVLAPFRLVGNALAAFALAASGDFKAAGLAMEAAFTEPGGAVLDALNKPIEALDFMGESMARLQGAAEKGLGAVSSGASSTVEPLNNAGAKAAKLAAELQVVRDSARGAAKAILGIDKQEAFNKQREQLQALLTGSLEDRQLAQEALIELELQEAERKDAILIRDVERLQERNDLLKQIDEKKNADEIASNQKKIDAMVKAHDQESKAVTKITAKRVGEEKALEESRVKTMSTIFGNIATLQRTGSKELFAIGKAAALAQATVDGYAAIQAALKSGPPPLNFILAASVGVATGVQIANIAATKLASGITSVPPGFDENRGGGGFQASLSSGERVINVEQNKDLTELLNRKS